ncbi:MAG: tRNA (guanosine(46)-N7)-methyltransferase TrmB [Mycobacteriales bacterium]
MQHQEIRSYLVRRGRTGPTSRDALERLWPVYGVSELSAVRARLPSVVEIGFGMGEATVALAAAEPARELLAIEVHPAGIAALLRRLSAADLHNVRVWEGDAVPVLQALPDACLEEVRLFFPDPWPKARHVKRRLLRPSFVALLERVLAPGGRLHLATDWPAYAEHAREVLAGWSLTPDRRSRPVTGYERRAHRDGRATVDLVCRPPQTG